MIIFNGIIRASSLLLNLICSLVVPVVESIAYRLRVGEWCECPSPYSSSPTTDRARKHKKLKNSATGGGQSHHHHDVKRIKLLLDITVAQNGNQVLDIQATTTKGNDEGYRAQKHCKKDPSLLLLLLNFPSSVMLWFVGKLRQLAHNLEAWNHPPCDDTNRIKKSPKRRITRANYRKIIPFFPFNLLGFSNYSAFQMPSITHASSSVVAPAEEKNNLNVSSTSACGNEKSRCKRRRNSSTDENSISSLSDEDISYLGFPEKSALGAAAPSSTAGHDEVDSDETAETVTKKISSSSSCDISDLRLKNIPASTDGNDDGKKIIVSLNTSTSEDNGGGGNVTSMTDLDSSSTGVVGEERHVQFSCIKELNEAANESYNSLDDPDYVPLEEDSLTTSHSSFATDDACSDESLLRENGTAKEGDVMENELEEKLPVVEEAETRNLDEDVKEKTNGNDSAATPIASSQTNVANSNSGSKKKQKNKRQNGTSNNSRHSPISHPNNLENFSTGYEDDYKTPEEGEQETHPF